MCTYVAVSCNGRGTGVTAMAGGSCFCTCPENYAGSRCDRCAEGYENYPNCEDACTLPRVSCRGDAFNVTGTPPDCQCNCFRNFTGDRCTSCSEGFVQYPFCFDSCTNANVSCNGIGLSVSGDIDDCLCECPPRYSGTRCELCATGYENYPRCTDDCTVLSISCKSRAYSVARQNSSYKAPKATCICDCLEGFAGLACEQCAAGYDGYPYCADNCSNTQVSCNNHAKDVSALLSDTSSRVCVCNCSRGFAGDRCQRCADGFGDYPRCSDKCRAANVSCFVGHATQVVDFYNATLNATQCMCTCLPRYSGRTCDSCADGYSGFPDCIDDCTNMTVSCSGHATSLGGILGSCLCQCDEGYNGTRCDTCHADYAGYPNCTRRPTAPPPPPPFYVVDYGSSISARAIRLMSDVWERTVIFRIVNGTFNTMKARKSALGPNWFWYQCLQLVAEDADEDNAFGFEDRRGSLWAPSSIISFNDSTMTIVFLGDTDFEIITDTTVHVIVDANCTVEGREPTNYPSFRIRADSVDSARRAGITSSLTTASAISFFSSNPSALEDAQMLILLGSMGCARTSLRSSTDAGVWLLSPFGWWGPRGARFLGVLLPFLLVPAAHFAVMLFVVQKEQQKQQAPKRGKHKKKNAPQEKEVSHQSFDAPNAKVSALIDSSVEARFRFPGLSLLLTRLLLPGLCFHSATYIRSWTATGILSGLLGGAVAVAFVSGVIVWACMNFSRITYVSYPPESLPRLPALRLFLPTLHASPEVEEKKMFGFINDYRELRFASVDMLVILITASLAAFQPYSRAGCVLQYSLFGIWFLSVAIATVVLRPYRTAFLNASAFVVYLSLTVIAVCSAVENDEPDGAVTDAVSTFTTIVVTLCVIRAVVGLISIVYEYQSMIQQAAKQMMARLVKPEEKADDDLFLTESSDSEDSVVGQIGAPNFHALEKPLLGDVPVLESHESTRAGEAELGTDTSPVALRNPLLQEEGVRRRVLVNPWLEDEATPPRPQPSALPHQGTMTSP